MPVGFIGAVMTLARRYIYPGVWCWPWQDAERIQREREQKDMPNQIVQQQIRVNPYGMNLPGWADPFGQPTAPLTCTGEDACACGLCEQDRKRRQQARAEFRAHDLLLEKLAPEQQAEWKKDHSFTVQTASKRLYRIKGTHGRSFNVFLLDDAGKEIKSFCATKYGDLPLHDLLLTQKLALETDEAGFLLTANKNDLRNPFDAYGLGIQPEMIAGGYGPNQIRVR